MYHFGSADKSIPLGAGRAAAGGAIRRASSTSTTAPVTASTAICGRATTRPPPLSPASARSSFLARAAGRRRPRQGRGACGRGSGERVMLKLKDGALLRQQAYVDGAWVDADSGATREVANPATGERLGTVPDMGAAETRRAIEAAAKAFPAWAAKTAGERASDPATLVRPHDGESGRSRRAHDRGAGQAARRIQGRDRLCRVLHRVVRRGRQAALRRCDPGPPGRQAHPGAAPAHRRGGRDHALELSRGHDHPQGRPGARGRLHLRLQARAADPLLRARDGGARRARRRSRRCSQHRDGRRCRRDRRRDDFQPGGAQAHLHRLHGRSASG